MSAGATVAVLAMLGVLWLMTAPGASSWEVARLDGAPRTGTGPVVDTTPLAVGEWLETDEQSRARVEVANIGEVVVEPNARVRLLASRRTEHRLALDRGTIHARIWAPPRLFFVDTPSATAIDLGCAYTLEVDDAGASHLRVTSGWVALEQRGRTSIVPAGAVSVTRPDRRPSPPYFEDASPSFKHALARLEADSTDATAFQTVLREARAFDTLTLWHLLFHVSRSRRGALYDAIAAFIPPPRGVTREGVIGLHETMVTVWRRELEMHWVREDLPFWKEAWRTETVW